MASENWTNKYLENSDINYGASDYATYRQSFISLLQKLYPENFNDYIDNSEVIMMMSALAYLGENLNYVVEMNTRDNFPATTERLESLLNFARMINYPVKRNVCASGLAKIVQIQTKITSRSGGRIASGSVSVYQQYAATACSSYGWTETDVECLISLWNKESGWNPYAYNSSSGAYGIPQALPGSKMASAGSDYKTNYQTQINWGLSYISSRYGSPQNAWSHWLSKGWY